MYKKDLALNNLQCLRCHKTKLNLHISTIMRQAVIAFCCVLQSE